MTQSNEKPQANAPEQDAPPPMPRWVKVFVLVLGIIFVSVVILHATGHRLGRHGDHRIGKGDEQSDGSMTATPWRTA